MKPFGRKIHWPTKALSNKNYINEVSVDGKKTNRFNFRLGFYELYIGQVMRVGNCLTLLSTPPAFSLQIFKSTNLFDDAAKYIFWTFNATYLHTLEKYFSTLSSEELKDTLSILQTNPESYVHIDGNEADEELIWCSVKNEHLKKDSKFALIYEKDKKNRQEVARLLESAVSALADPQAQKTEIPVPTFPQMVNYYRENLCTNSINRRTKPNCFIFIQNRPKIQVEKAILKQLEKQKKYLLQQVFV